MPAIHAAPLQGDDGRIEKIDDEQSGDERYRQNLDRDECKDQRDQQSAEGQNPRRRFTE